MFTDIQEIVGEIYNNFNFNIIHSHVALPDGYAGMKIAKLFSMPLVTTIHGQDFQQTIFKNKKYKEILLQIY